MFLTIRQYRKRAYLYSSRLTASHRRSKRRKRQHAPLIPFYCYSAPQPPRETHCVGFLSSFTQSEYTGTSREQLQSNRTSPGKTQSGNDSEDNSPPRRASTAPRTEGAAFQWDAPSACWLSGFCTFYGSSNSTDLASPSANGGDERGLVRVTRPIFCTERPVPRPLSNRPQGVGQVWEGQPVQPNRQLRGRISVLPCSWLVVTVGVSTIGPHIFCFCCYRFPPNH